MINIETLLSKEEIEIGMDLIFEELQSRNKRGENPLKGYEILKLIKNTFDTPRSSNWAGSMKRDMKILSKFKEKYSNKLESIGYTFPTVE